jgi:hypothetical protein
MGLQPAHRMLLLHITCLVNRELFCAGSALRSAASTVCWLHLNSYNAHCVCLYCCLSVMPAAGHVGYELSPFIPTLAGVWALLSCGLRGSPGLNTVQHHDMHHRFPTKHFSLYFTHWDRWMGTLHPKYDAGLFRYFDTSAQAADS